MHANWSYRGNRPTNKQINKPQTHKQTHTQTGPITIHCAAKLSAQCNYPSLGRGPAETLSTSLSQWSAAITVFLTVVPQAGTDFHSLHGRRLLELSVSARQTCKLVVIKHQSMTFRPTGLERHSDGDGDLWWSETLKDMRRQETVHRALWAAS